MASLIHLKKVPWVVTTSFVSDHHIILVSIMLAVHQGKWYHILETAEPQCRCKRQGVSWASFQLIPGLQTDRTVVCSFHLDPWDGVSFMETFEQYSRTRRAKLNLPRGVFRIIIADVEKLVAAQFCAICVVPFNWRSRLSPMEIKQYNVLLNHNDNWKSIRL